MTTSDTSTSPQGRGSAIRDESKRAIDAVRRRARRAKRQAHRRLLGRGHAVECSVCGWHGARFAPSAKPRRPNRICPSCKSNERYRAFELWLREQTVREGARLLEIAPIKLVEPTVTALGYEYTSLDLKSPRARVRGDLCHLPFAPGTFDVVVCFHVLEHIRDDVAAAASMAACLAPEGRVVIVVPWDPTLADTVEDPDADPRDYERLYGQSDHVRIYGRDVTDRLRSGGLSVDEVAWSDVFDAPTRRRHALDGDDDRFWMCTRSETSPHSSPESPPA